MSSAKWVAEVLEQAAQQWKDGEPFESNADAKSILQTVESVYAMVGDEHEEMGRTLIAIATALSSWRAGKAGERQAELLSDMAKCFRDVANLRAS